MRRCAVIGSPIQHSMSPLLHRAAYEQLGIADEFSYDRFEVTPETLDTFLAGLDESWVGLSVTAPNKQALLTHGVCDEIATTLQSGNTLILGRDGEPNRVHNTDVTGMLGALRRIGVTLAEKVILVGAGATARSALWAVAQLGAREVEVLARNAQRAHDSLDRLAADLGISLEVAPLAVAEDGQRADLLVSTIPAELDPELVTHLIGRCEAVFEVVYNHYPSAFDQAAVQAGLPHLDGLDLLVGQAIDQIRLMTGREADPEPLLEICRAEVLRRG